jgi:menaquinone-specific isochorismate synthase
MKPKMLERHSHPARTASEPGPQAPHRLRDLTPTTRTSARTARRSLVSWSQPWPLADLTPQAALLAFLSWGQPRPDAAPPIPGVPPGGAPRIYWESDQAPLAYAGFGVAAVLTASGPERFQKIESGATQLFEHSLSNTGDTPSVITPRLFGGFSFRSAHRPAGVWSAFPAASFLLPRYQLTHHQGQLWLTVNHCPRPHQAPDAILRQLRQEAAALCARADLLRPMPQTPPNGGHADLLLEELMTQATWEQAVSQIVARIRRGELDKAVLARACRVRGQQPPGLPQVLAHLQQHYPDCYRFLIEPLPGHACYGATPELLAEVNGATLRTVALAGTARRGRSAEEDAALGQSLLDSPKERHEHALVVEAIQTNLRPLVSDLQLPAVPLLRKLGTLQHLQTPIQGQLHRPGSILPVVAALHPTPALGGTPRQVALNLIDEVEPLPRGWYAGAVGWLDGQGNGLFAVAIRSAVTAGNESWLFAGAGIVGDSNPQREWEETHLKFRPMRQALAEAGQG